MNIQYLKYALEVEKAGSISKAAENLYMSQPNLSKAIKELETIVGVSLFERTTKGISATTEDGRAFLEYAKNILEQFEDMKSYFQKINRKKIFFRASIPRASYITEAFTLFINGIEEKEDFYIGFRETNSIKAIKNVAQDGHNLGIIRYRSIYEPYFLPFLLEKELRYQKILESELVIIMSDKNHLAGKEILEFSDLDNMIEIIGDDFTIPRQLLSDKSKVDFLPYRRKQISIYEKGNQFDLLTHVPNTFMWGSPMLRDVLIRNSLIQKKCNADDMNFKDILIYRQGHIFSKLEQSFLNSIEQVKISIMLEAKKFRFW